MATIILGSVGKLFGPIGQIAGTLAGSAIDRAIFGSNDIEGARLKELAVTGSSYGTPIARTYGAIRVPGTIVWSTDLKEHRAKQSNGKGKPKTVTYSYSVSFAVALSSRPIERVGRIWADGNLLRGADGELKSGGALRVYQGHGEQDRDPLLGAELGGECPAFRGRAYAVFEDLDLTDFGNRIPALSFEVFAGDASRLVETALTDRGLEASEGARFPELAGFAHEGGNLRDVLRLVDRLHPLAPMIAGDGLRVAGNADLATSPIALPEPAAWDEGDFGAQAGMAQSRNAARRESFASLRYYDPARDYQPGLQHASNSESGTRDFQFPGVFSASDALSLAQRANDRAAMLRDRLSWRCAELDPAIGPGALVLAPGHPGLWQVASWEWRERGVELELVRYREATVSQPPADAGSPWSPPDRSASPTVLHVFEAPWDGIGNGNARRAFVAASAASGRWHGCALYAARDGALVPLGQSVTERAIMGQLVEPLGPSPATRFEASASLEVQLVDARADLQSTDLAGLAQGDNRMLVGTEVLQFRTADPVGGGVWRLSGLLRGRGGTEIDAATEHASGTPVVLLDDRLVVLDEETLNSAGGFFAALGLQDEEPVLALLANPGAGRRPPSPVHPRFSQSADGSLDLAWTRRARGQWTWPDEVDQPLVEESERYEVGCGPLSAPVATWRVDASNLQLGAAAVTDLAAQHAGAPLWVRQLGSFAKSRALLLGHL